MLREISSNTQTALMKLTVPLFFGGIAIFLGVAFFFSISNSSIKELIYTFILFVGFSTFAFFNIRWVFRLKQVELAKDGIFVSHTHFAPKKEIFVPFEKIKSVSQSFWQWFGNPETVKIEFIEETEFGKEIKFIPKTRFFPLLEHPIVNELNLILKESKWRKF